MTVVHGDTHTHVSSS